MLSSTALPLFLSYLAVCSSLQPSKESYDVHRELLNALQNANLTRFALSELFFPRQGGGSPVCAPIRYVLNCEVGGDQYNASFLWSLYDTQSFSGRLLVSSAYYGFTLAGFDWENQCLFFGPNTTTVVQLNVEMECSEEIGRVLLEELTAFTSALKAYVSQSSVTISGSTIDSYKAYAVQWNETNQDDYIFHQNFIVLVILVCFLDIFIFFLSLGTGGTVYDKVYEEIRHKKNPYYPIFYSVVFLSVIWNAYPGWAVLTINVAGLQFIVVAIVILQFFTALFMRKYPDFPIPGFKWTHHCKLPSAPHESSPANNKKKKHPKPEKYVMWKIFQLGPPFHVLLTIAVQTIAIWSLLVLYTFIVYYAVTVAVALYLNPILTLIKVLFIKAVALCAVFGVALLFTSSSLQWKLSKKACLNNLTVIAMLIAAVSFLPILAYLTYMIGGFIFSANINQLNGIQGVLAILPSAFLLLVGWESRGKLFPEKLVEAGSLDEVSKDVKEADHSAGGKPDSLHANGPKGNHSPSQQPATTGYGSVEVYPSSNLGDEADERRKLIPAKTV